MPAKGFQLVFSNAGLLYAANKKAQHGRQGTLPSYYTGQITHASMSC